MYGDAFSGTAQAFPGIRLCRLWEQGAADLLYTLPEPVVSDLCHTPRTYPWESYPGLRAVPCFDHHFSLPALSAVSLRRMSGPTAARRWPASETSVARAYTLLLCR